MLSIAEDTWRLWRTRIEQIQILTFYLLVVLSQSRALGYYKNEEDKGIQGLKQEIVDLLFKSEDLGWLLGEEDL